MEKQKSVLDTIHILYDNFFEQEKKSQISSSRIIQKPST